MPFAHVAIAVEGCGWTNPENIPLMIANTIIGSYDRSMNIMPQSKSFAENVLRYNMVNSYQAFNTCYKDTGKTYFIISNIAIYLEGKLQFSEAVLSASEAILTI